MRLLIMIGAFFICTDLLPMDMPNKVGEGQSNAKKPRLVLLAPEIPPTMSAADKELLEASAAGDEARVLKALAHEANINARDAVNRTALYIAATNGHEGVVRLLLERGAQREAANKNGATPLFIAAQRGHEGVVRLLLEGGAQREAANKDGATPLYIAAQQGHEGVVRLLLERGAQREAAQKDGATPLYIAAQQGHEGIVRLLLDGGAQKEAAQKDGLTPLHMAAQDGHEGVVRLLLDSGAQIEAATKDGVTPLHIAVQQGHEGVVRLLLERGAQREAANKNGATPLYIAAQRGHEGVVRLLLERGAQREAAQKDGATPLYIAAQQGHEGVVRLLLERGAQREAAQKDGATPLYIAAQRGHEGVVRLLLEGGAQREAANKDGATPLYIAAQQGHEGVVRLLLDSGAQREAATKDGVTPLYIAAQQGHEGVVRLLLEGGAQREAATKDGVTPLHIAVQQGHEGVVRLLLDSGAQIEAATKDGVTPLYIAAQRGHEGVVRLLLEGGAQKEAAQKDGLTPLHMAAQDGHEGVVRLLLYRGANSNARTNRGVTPVMMAAHPQGHFNVVHEILSHPQAAVNAANAGGQTALALARATNRADVAQLLYRYGAEDFGRGGLPQAPAEMPESEREQHRRQMILERVVINPLHRAAASGNFQEVEKNVGMNPPLNEIQEALLYAAGRGHAHVVNRLLRAGADPREALKVMKTILQRSFLAPEERRQYEVIRTMLVNRLPALMERILENPELHATLIGRRFYELPRERRELLVSREEHLIRGIQAGRLDEVRSDLQAGTDPNARDAQGNTALWVAALTQPNQEFIFLLLQNGADPTIPTEGQTLIQWAARRQNPQLVRDLLLFGAHAPEDIIRTYLEGRLVPEAALGRAEELLRLVSDPTIARQEFEVALLYAATQGHETVVRILMTALSDPQPHAQRAVQTILQRRGLSAYDAARYHEMVRILSVMQPMASQRTPEDEQLLQAIHNGNPVDVAAALDAHADPNAQDPEGRVAIDIAAHHKDSEKAAAMVTLLIERDAFPNPVVDHQGRTLLMEVLNRPTIATLIVAELQRRGILGGVLQRPEIRVHKRLFDVPGE